MRVSYQARPIQSADRPAIHQVLRDTLMLGQPLPFPVMDLDLMLGYFTDFYLEHEPEAGLAIVDDSGRLAGYMIGTTQPQQQRRWQQRAAARLLWRWATHWRQYDPFTRWFYRLRLLDARETIVNPDPPVPAHVHWHLLPEVRGHWGRKLMLHFRDYVGSRGVPEFGGDYPLLESRKDATLWNRLGADVIHQAPHHTLTALLGEPVTRITLRSRVDVFHW